MAILSSRTKNKILISNLTVAQTFLERGYGLIPKKNLSDNEGLLIGQCKSIHTFFMSFAIDCIFVNKEMTVKALVENVSPWRLTSYYRKADSVIELSAGSIRRLEIELGDQLHVGH